MTTPTVLVHRDPDELAAAVAARFITRLTDVQAAQGVGVGRAHRRHHRRAYPICHSRLARAGLDRLACARRVVERRAVPARRATRSATRRRRGRRCSTPCRSTRRGCTPCRPSDGPDGDDPEAAAQRYADELAAAARYEDHGAAPTFDLLLLGVGPDGHIASLFPDRPAVYETERTVVAVRGAPKPPPIRLTMTPPVISGAKDVWLVVSGADKARAVALALSGAGSDADPGGRSVRSDAHTLAARSGGGVTAARRPRARRIPLSRAADPPHPAIAARMRSLK